MVCQKITNVKWLLGLCLVVLSSVQIRGQDVCEDLNEDCSLLGKEACVYSAKEYAKQWCRKTCGYCSTLLPCVDKEARCSLFGKQICSLATTWALDNCMRFCGFCHAPEPPPTKPPRTTASTSTTVTTTTPILFISPKWHTPVYPTPTPMKQYKTPTPFANITKSTFPSSNETQGPSSTTSITTTTPLNVTQAPNKNITHPGISSVNSTVIPSSNTTITTKTPVNVTQAPVINITHPVISSVNSTVNPGSNITQTTRTPTNVTKGPSLHNNTNTRMEIMNTTQIPILNTTNTSTITVNVTLGPGLNNTHTTLTPRNITHDPSLNTTNSTLTQVNVTQTPSFNNTKTTKDVSRNTTSSPDTTLDPNTTQTSTTEGHRGFCISNGGGIHFQDDTWIEECAYKCTCKGGAEQGIKCQALCWRWELPDSRCSMQPPAPGKCCPTPKCPAGVIIDYPPNYKEE